MHLKFFEHLIWFPFYMIWLKDVKNQRKLSMWFQSWLVISTWLHCDSSFIRGGREVFFLKDNWVLAEVLARGYQITTQYNHSYHITTITRVDTVNYISSLFWWNAVELVTTSVCNWSFVTSTICPIKKWTILFQFEEFYVLLIPWYKFIEK